MYKEFFFTYFDSLYKYNPRKNYIGTTLKIHNCGDWSEKSFRDTKTNGLKRITILKILTYTM